MSNLQASADDKIRVGALSERTRIVLKQGDTFWRLAEIKYEGKHPIEAIFEANQLQPEVIYEKGRRAIVDPVYYAGREYVLPAWAEVEALRDKFWQGIDAEYPLANDELMDEMQVDSSRLTPREGNARKAVNLRWDETLWSAAQQTFGDSVPIEAIYELNGLTPKVVVFEGKKVLQAPVYPGGRTYLLPAPLEIAALKERLWKRLGMDAN